MYCYFRTNVTKTSGLGNYKRCLRLAENLHRKGHDCTIFTDNKLKKNLFNNKQIKHKQNYHKKNIKFSELKDAKNFLKNSDIPGFVFVDDTRIGIPWQKKIKNFHKKLIVITDVTKKNVADILINTKPDYLNPSIIEKEKIKNKEKKLLLGPRYAILEKKIKNNVKKNNIFKIVFYFGGSGDLTYASKIIKEFVFSKIFFNYKIFVIIGPNSKNYKSLITLQKKIKSKLNLIYSPNNFSKLLKNFDLYIGSAGVSMFETSLYKIPSILFKTSFDQEVDISCLEKIGHYFLMEKNDLRRTKKICKIINIFFENKKRIKSIINSRQYKVDDKGSDRIIDEVFKRKKFTRSIVFKKKKEQTKRKFKPKIKKINDKYINKYLYVSNNSINRKNSLTRKKINKIDHYIWWFKNNRKSFIFTKNDEEIIFFFHEYIRLNNAKFIVPGWYIIKRDASFLDIIMGLKKQYNILQTAKDKEKITQLGVINKNNKSMIKFAPKLNWIKLSSSEILFKELAKKINSRKFVFYKR